MTAGCLNLAQLFGGRYVVRQDPAHPRHSPADPWMMLLRSRIGVIFPYGQHLLGVEIEGRPSIRKRLDGLGCCRRYLAGERFGCWLFHVRDFERVAAVVKPARKRGWTDSERKERAGQLKANLRKRNGRRVDSRISSAVSTMTGSRGPTGVR
jgi:hypothetical protein